MATKYLSFRDHLNVGSEEIPDELGLAELNAVASDISSQLEDASALLDPANSDFQSVFPDFIFYQDPPLLTVEPDLWIDSIELDPAKLNAQQASLASIPFEQQLQANSSYFQNLDMAGTELSSQIGEITLQDGSKLVIPSSAFSFNQNLLSKMLSFSQNLTSNALVKPDMFSKVDSSNFTSYISKIASQKSSLIESFMIHTNKMKDLSTKFRLNDAGGITSSASKFDSMFKMQKNFTNLNIKSLVNQEALMKDLHLEMKVPKLDWLKLPNKEVLPKLTKLQL
jgi:hypothetical protein